MENELKCPICNHELVSSGVFELSCSNVECPLYINTAEHQTWKILIKHFTVLQKKLDKAMEFLKGFERAEQFGALAQEFRDVIKEIENIKE